MNSPEEIVGRRLGREAAIARADEADARATAAANLQAARQAAMASIRGSLASLAGYEYFEAKIIRPTLKTHGRFRTKADTSARVARKLTSELERDKERSGKKSGRTSQTWWYCSIPGPATSSSTATSRRSTASTTTRSSPSWTGCSG